ncbi:MAG: zeta toxin family protein [Planctomycetes bacterium]|nr:zeta toxin family protein [Planctomycetota bacterium]
MARKPTLAIIAGPNGAGKSTLAPALIHKQRGIDYFVNADTIARGLAAFAVEKVAISAGRVMLDWLHELGERGESFAFETTLASRSFAPWIAKLVQAGYEFHLLYVWVPDPSMSVMRVASRVREGGHFVPDDDVQRRWARSLNNFFELYQPLTTQWQVYDNTSGSGKLVAEGIGTSETAIYEVETWQKVKAAR